MEGHDGELNSLINVKLNVVNVKMSRQIGQAVQAIADLRLPEWRIISLLSSSGGMSQADIRSNIGMDKGQISRTVKTMVSNELIRFDGQDGQARNVRLALTSKGKDIHTHVDTIMQKHKDHVLASLSSDEKQSFYNSLHHIEKSIDAWRG